MRLLTYAVLVLLLTVPMAAHTAAVKPLHVLYIEGQIDPAVADYISDGIRNAENEGAQAALILMDTPGGRMDSMERIVKAFFASRVPVIVYVYPNGALAASAGALIAIAADIAAMSPATSIGASSPISIAPGGEVEKLDETLKRKVTNYTAEYAKSIAQKRGRNVKWAEAAVRQASTLTSSDALKQDVIDYVSETIPDLMKQVDGRKVKLVSGGTVTLRTASAPLEERPMGAWDTFLHILSNPYVTLFLTLAAMYGIIYELANPGSIFPGVIGGISIILLLYSYSVIPVNTAGFAFIALAILLFAVDLFTPTHGILTVGGVISMFFGLMMLFRSAEGFMVSIGTIAAVAITTGAFFFFLIGLGVRALKKPYIAGREGVVGHIGTAKTDLDLTGKVFIDGGLWSATSESGMIAKGEFVEVTKMTGLKLTVRKAAE
ncbi:MAG: nodulation protein NfeD [Armatimonadetes bacterium]|nr:nodulation protein NfeD [Armatimonadota bacterium]